MSYANKTSVPVGQSQVEVRKILMKNGAEGVAIGETNQGASTQFIFEGKPYKFTIIYPSDQDERFTHTNKGKERTAVQLESELEAEKRRLWRCMVLYIKACIEAHVNGLVNLKRSMIGNMQLPSGKTFYEAIDSDLGRFEANPRFMIE